MRRSLMRVAILAVAVSLAGCTTIDEMRSHEPKGSYLSSRSAPALEECLATRLSYIDPPSVIRGERETTVSFGFGLTTDAAITLRPEGSATRVEVRTVLPYKGRFRSTVENCVR